MPKSPVVAAAREPAREPAQAPSQNPANYEQALAELDRLVATMEGGQMPLDQLLDGYRRGSDLLAYCRSQLQAVEDQVKLLEDGQLKSLGGERSE